jgi:CubicO group peptidase (beta-lactamase class C family)
MDGENEMEITGEEILYFPGLENESWLTTDPLDLGWDLDMIEELKLFLNEADTRAFVVLKDGKIVIEHYNGRTILGGQFSRNSQWYWASAGKTLTSFLVGIAQKENFLSIDDSSKEYLPGGWSSLTSEQEAKIKIFHHLSMTTGLDDKAQNGDCTSPECFLYKTEPGERWSYHNAPYTILDKVIEGATQLSFDDFFNSRLRDPIGMTGQWSYLGDNHVYFSNALSMARFGLLVLNNGKWKDRSILDGTDFISEMIMPSQSHNKAYGYLWWLNGYSPIMLPGSQIQLQRTMSLNAPEDMFAAIGKNSQYLNIVPSKGLVIVRLGDQPDSALVPIQLQEEIWSYLNNIIPD